VLEAEDLPLGIVTGIAAQLRFELTVSGRAGHAGTSPMPLRHDALAAAAECVLAAEAVAREAGSTWSPRSGACRCCPAPPT
jgi:allantoate deiminase